MHEIAAGVTDLLLGTVLVAAALWLQRSPLVRRYWPLTFWSAGAGAFAGAAHHLLFRGSPRASDLSWVAVGVLVAVAISYLLAASATELLEPPTARFFIRLRIGGLVAYLLVISTLGIGRTTPLVLSESVTMASIVGLWCYGLYAGQPAARRMLVAIAACAMSSIFFALPAWAIPSGGLDARSLQHLAQIPGVLLLCRAAAGTGAGRQPVPAPPSWTVEQA